MRIFLLRHTYVTVLAAIAAAAAIFHGGDRADCHQRLGYGAAAADLLRPPGPEGVRHQLRRGLGRRFHRGSVGILNRYGVKATFSSSATGRSSIPRT